MVAVPVGVGLYAWHRRPQDRFGPLLITLGFGWFLTTLAESDDDLLYSVGRVAGWVVEIGLVYLVLAFPSGRLPGRVDRALVTVAVVLLVVLYLPTAFLFESYPVQSPWTSCSEGCPGNAFFVLDHEPGFVGSVVKPLREGLTILLFAAVALRLGWRVHRATPLLRRTLSPVLAVAIPRLVLFVMAIVARSTDLDATTVDVLDWLIALGVPAMALAFLVGLLRWRLFVGQALHTLAIRLRGSAAPKQLRDAMAEAFHDERVWLAYPAPDVRAGWVDAEGRSVSLPAPDEDQCVAEVRDGARILAAIVYDPALSDQRELIDAAAAYAKITLDNQALTAEVRASLRELEDSRARMVASADEERRRIERDLHDGAQQRLVALRIKLELTEELLERDPAGGIDRLHALGAEVTEALEEIRSLARGVYPSRLADRGLPEALRAAALEVPIDTVVVPDGVGRYSQEIESAVYFSVLEALQNASKHADGANRITVLLHEDGDLRFEVRDDGAGFEPRNWSAGAGLTNIRDRMDAVGGALRIESAPRRGTTVSGSIPLP